MPIPSPGQNIWPVLQVTLLPPWGFNPVLSLGQLRTVKMVGPEGFEPPPQGFVGLGIIQLCYGPIKLICYTILNLVHDLLSKTSGEHASPYR